MKKARHSLTSLTALLFLLIIVFPSCQKFLDLQPNEVLLPEQVYRDKYDANAAIRGIYGKLMNLAPQYVVLNELRADLMDVTSNADINLRDLNLHNAKPGNPWIDPQPFYSLINDCNDALKNFHIMLIEHKLLQEDYNQRYSDIATLRSWVYLQLVIHYGEVPYITEPLVKVDDIDKLKNSKYPVLNIEQMVDTLVNFVEKIPYKDRYSDASLRTTIDGYDTRIMFIDKLFFLGDLYLWKGDYLQACSYYKQLMDRDIGSDIFNSYKIASGDVYTLTRYNSGYVRYYWQDINSRLNNWPKMFSAQPGEEYYDEMIWVLYFHSSYTPTNPFIDLFSKDYGSYYLKPSRFAIDNWKSQIQNNNFSGDFRGETGSYILENQEPVITKYTANYSNLNPFDKSGKWFLNRAGGLHLRYSEAVNRTGRHKIAYSLINNGIRPNYSAPSGELDITYYERTNETFPFNFDARMASGAQIPVGMRGLYHRNTGIRGRVYLQNINDPIAPSDTLNVMENKILDEMALELAYEGQRWGDLVRIAIRRNDPSYLADKIYEKLEKAGYSEASAVRQKLMTRANWFLPLSSK